MAAVNDRLTPTDRRIAELALADPTLLAFGTVSELAERLDVSGPSVVRFARKLGFDGYTDLQANVRREVSHALARPSQRMRAAGSASIQDRAELTRALARTFDLATDAKIDSFVRPIIEASSVLILSGETSRAGAHVTMSGLSMLRPDVALIDDHAVGAGLTHTAPGDVAVVFDFYRYRKVSFDAASFLAERGITILAVTDGPLSPFASLADAWCEAEIPAVGPFDSSMPAVVVAELLVAAVARAMGDAAIDSIDSVELAWEATNTFRP